MSVRAAQLVAKAMSRPEAERDAFVVGACAGDEAMLREARLLLAARQDAARAMAPPGSHALPTEEGVAAQHAIADAILRERPGDVIGRYKLLQQIGEGGFGVVFMAEQTEPLIRRVALKVIKLGMDTRQVVARFEAERQALALMDHPNIAKVLDGGATANGRPYFVMELVRGVPITTYCDSHRLSTRDRLGLFSLVCGAVQHAHQRGVIHRDIKPTNVLVGDHDGRPVPKVIDFGIAKATSSRLTERTLFTEFRQFIGSPEYMSPEQASFNDLDIDTRTDVYSLGVLLYELLVGTTPLDSTRLRAGGYDEMRRMIRDLDPVVPSTRLGTLDDTRALAHRRHTEPEALRRDLRGDLDWIVMRCLEKDRTRRYDSPSRLAEDIERHLADRPVEAGPPSATYRIGKFVRRHRAAVAVAGALATLLVLGTIGTTAGLVLAIRARNNAEAARIEAEAAQEKAVRANGLLAQQAAHERSVNALIEDWFLRPLPIRENTATQLFELEQRAEAVFGRGDPRVAATLGALGTRLTCDMARQHEGSRLLEVAVAYGRTAARDRSAADPSAYLSLAHDRVLSNPESALPLVREAVAVCEAQYGSDAIETAAAREALALHALMTIGRDRSRIAEIDDAYARALATYERTLGADHARTIEARCGLGQIRWIDGRQQEAEPILRQALDRALPHRDVRPTIKFTTANALAEILKAQGRVDDAVQVYRKLPPLIAAVSGADSAAYRRYVGACVGELRAMGATDAAEWMNGQLNTTGDGPSLAMRYANARAQQDAGEHARAATEAEAIRDEIARRIAASPDTPSPLLVAGERLLGRLAVEARAGAGDVAAAVEAADRAVRAAEASLGPDHPETLLARASLAEVRIAAGEDAVGRAELERVCEQAVARSPGQLQVAQDIWRRLSTLARERRDDEDVRRLEEQVRRMSMQRRTSPPAGGFEDEDVDGPPRAWSITPVAAGAGTLAVVVDSGAAEGERCVLLGGLPGADAALQSSGGFVNLMRTFDAMPYRGKRVRFAAAVRVAANTDEAEPSVQLWIRADRPNGRTARLFDNMFGRAARSTEWTTHEVGGVVDADADVLNVGFMLFGDGAAWIDDVRFEVVEDDAPADG